jgi:hypothetical protein
MTALVAGDLGSSQIGQARSERRYGVDADIGRLYRGLARLGTHLSGHQSFARRSPVWWAFPPNPTVISGLHDDSGAWSTMTLRCRVRATATFAAASEDRFDVDP